MLRRILSATSLALIGAAWFFYLSQPWPLMLRHREPGMTAFMAERLATAEERGRPLELHHTWVPLSRISPHLEHAVLVAEDARFYHHGAVDWAALAEELHYRDDGAFSVVDPGDLAAAAGALGYYLDHRHRIRGRSTITQQLAKNLYFSPRRSLIRKLEEAIVAQRLEWFLGKRRILELYLNTAEWGPGIFGAEAAARHYYGKPARALTVAEAAALAATLPHPLTSNPRLRPGRMAWRKRLILARMGVGGEGRTVPLDPLALDSIATPPVKLDTTVHLPTIRLDTLPAVPMDTIPSARLDTIPGDTVPRHAN